MDNEERMESPSPLLAETVITAFVYASNKAPEETDVDVVVFKLLPPL